MIPKRVLSRVVLGVVLSIAVLSLYYRGILQHGLETHILGDPPLPPPDPPKVRPPGPIYKDKSKVKVRPPISDPFPLLGDLDTGDLPAIPSWNRPPSPHVPEKTPLFIGFTRNWPLLQQCVLGMYSAACFTET